MKIKNNLIFLSLTAVLVSPALFVSQKAEARASTTIRGVKCKAGQRPPSYLYVFRKNGMAGCPKGFSSMRGPGKTQCRLKRGLCLDNSGGMGFAPSH